jgi:hypothetical protein
MVPRNSKKAIAKRQKAEGKKAVEELRKHAGKQLKIPTTKEVLEITRREK